ncbi:hypothetical protein D3C77_537000 [compost metagenome]
MKIKDYSYLEGANVEIHRSDYEFNAGKIAKVLEVKEDALRVLVLENGEEFWTDVDSVYHE